MCVTETLVEDEYDLHKKILEEKMAENFPNLIEV